MMRIRADNVSVAKLANKFGLILGTLGHQGSPKVMLTLKVCILSINVSLTNKLYVIH